jgi:hypothetical protein
MAKKIRMTSVIDHSTMGINLGTEMELSKATHRSMRSALKKFITDNNNNGDVTFRLVSGDYIKGDAVFYLVFVNRKGAETSILYEFKQRGNTAFLNVSGNPTTIIAGANDIPVLVIGSMFEKAYNGPTVTFKYLNRVMYSILDDILGAYGFVWSGIDKKRLVSGDISIQSYQIAWYSGSLGGKRAEVMRFCRLCYGGLNATTNKVENVGKPLGINARVWDNNDGNVTLEVRTGKNREFSLTLYAKDQDPSYDGKNNKRLRELIRFDCTLNISFLHNNNIKKVSDLEDKYIEVCEEDGFDVGFIRFISNKVLNKIKFYYLLSLTTDTYNDYKEDLENMLVDGNLTKHQRRYIKHWLEYGESYNTDKEMAEVLGMNSSRLSEVKAFLRNKLPGLDLSIPRTTHESVLFNRTLATLSEEERSDYLEATHGNSNKVVNFVELKERDTDKISSIKEVMGNMDGLVKIRKFQPTKIKPKDFWVIKEFNKAS